MKEFWNEELTKKSWDALIELNKRYKFILIGGWAVYLWSKSYKSKGIDIIVDYKELEKIKKAFTLIKNDNLKKFEVKQGFFDIDIYVPFYSKLTYPIEKIIKEHTILDGFKIPKLETILILKQGALISRKQTIKGKKDEYDIILLLRSGFDLKEYLKLIKDIKKEELLKELINTIRNLDPKDCDYFNTTFKELSKWKKDNLERLKVIK